MPEPRAHVEASLDAADTSVRTILQPVGERPERAPESVSVGRLRAGTSPEGADTTVRAKPAASVERLEEVVVRKESPAEPVIHSVAVEKLEGERMPTNNQGVAYRPVPEHRALKVADERREVRSSPSENVLTTSRIRIEDGARWPSQPPKVPQPANRRESEPEDRTVNVSIGRIEVRAVLPEARPTPVVRHAVQSARTLADYLKERDRGAR